MEKDADYTTDTLNGVSFFVSGARICTLKVYQQKVYISIRYQRTGCIKVREYPLDSQDRQYLMSLRADCDKASYIKYRSIKDRKLAHDEAEAFYGKAVYRYISSIPRSDSLF